MARRYVRDRIGRFAATAGAAAAKNYARGKAIKKITGAQAEVTLGNGRPQVGVSVGHGKFRKTVYQTGKSSGASGGAAKSVKGKSAKKAKGPSAGQILKGAKKGFKHGATLGYTAHKERKQRKAQKRARKRR